MKSIILSPLNIYLDSIDTPDYLPNGYQKTSHVIKKILSVRHGVVESLALDPSWKG